MINFEYYRTFYLVAKMESISGAAEILHISQPAVSYVVKMLEEGLGCQLFHRLPRGVRLTDAGKALYPHVESAVGQIRIGEQKIRNLANLEEGAINIGSIELALSYLLPPYIATFRSLYPRVKLHFFGPSTFSILDGIRDGTVDVGFVVSPLPEDCLSDLNLTPIKETRDICIAGNAYEDLRDKSLPLTTILAMPIITLIRQTAGRSLIETFARENGFAFHPDYSLLRPAHIVSFAEQNLGIGIVEEEFAAESMKTGRVFEVKTIPPLPRRQLYMVTGTLTPSAACRKFMELLEPF